MAKVIAKSAELTATTVVNFPFGSLRLTEKVTEKLNALGYTACEFVEDVNAHTGADGGPAVYVGTYRKYNNGSIFGAWVNLSGFDNFADFIKLCNALHADEKDPELMFQDFEGFPREYYSESGIDSNAFDAIKHYIELCAEYGENAVTDWLEISDNLDGFRDSYVGQYDSPEAYAEELINECYDLEKMMGNLANYFDYSAYARELFMCDYHFGSNGYVFNRNC